MDLSGDINDLMMIIKRLCDKANLLVLCKFTWDYFYPQILGHETPEVFTAPYQVSFITLV